MTSMDSTIVGSYSYPVAALAVCISVLASYTALDLEDLITASDGMVRRQVWLISGGVVLGIGIWSMHYTGMWAFRILCLWNKRISRGTKYSMRFCFVSDQIKVRPRLGTLP
jgi:NO-binding membrane sensor protein with MHYT domain